MEKIALEYANEQCEIFKIKDNGNADITKFGKLIDSDIESYLKKDLEKYI
jgi:hypothetical protein